MKLVRIFVQIFTVLVCACVFSPLLPGQQLTPAADSSSFVAASSLTGTWAPVNVTLHGYPLPEERRKSITFEITDGRFRFTSGDIEEQGTISVTAGSSGLPTSVDLVFEDGPNQGTTIRGICKIEDGKLFVCYATGGERPTEFASTLESETLLLEYQRVNRR
ncbi:MAG: TIGR03067 domain-containing protein [Pirellulaceae bacterium]